MFIARILNKFINFIYFIVKFRSIPLAIHLAHHHFPLSYTSGMRRKGNNILFTNSGNEIPANQLKHYETIFPQSFVVLNSPKVKVQDIDQQVFNLVVDGIKFRINSYSNLAVVYEIFFQLLYDIQFFQDNLVIMDIGMNIGAASLFFANNNRIKKIYGYEPFNNTFNEAIYNFKQNPILSQKIVPNNYGISYKNELLKVPFFESGDLSSSTISTFKEENIKKPEHYIEVNVKSIIEEIKIIINANASNPIFIKLDCEGEEYKIMELLGTTPYLDIIIGMVIEWHKKDPINIFAILHKHNYITFHVPDPQGASGLIYALKVQA